MLGYILGCISNFIKANALVVLLHYAKASFNGVELWAVGDIPYASDLPLDQRTINIICFVKLCLIYEYGEWLSFMFNRKLVQKLGEHDAIYWNIKG